MSAHLSPERAAKLRDDLRQLHKARQRAWVEIRTYPIRTACNNSPTEATT